MPDWYLAFVAADALRVPPWELVGFTYDDVAEMPICWREWALEYTFARIAANANRMARASS